MLVQACAVVAACCSISHRFYLCSAFSSHLLSSASLTQLVRFVQRSTDSMSSSIWGNLLRDAASMAYAQEFAPHRGWAIKLIERKCSFAMCKLKLRVLLSSWSQLEAR